MRVAVRFRGHLTKQETVNADRGTRYVLTLKPSNAHIHRYGDDDGVRSLVPFLQFSDFSSGVSAHEDTKKDNLHK